MRNHILLFLLLPHLTQLHAVPHKEDELSIEALLADSIPHNDTRLNETVVIGSGIKSPAQVALNAVSLDLHPMKGTTKSACELREGNDQGSEPLPALPVCQSL
jgi:hypothetical protein